MKYCLFILSFVFLIGCGSRTESIIINKPPIDVYELMVKRCDYDMQLRENKYNDASKMILWRMISNSKDKSELELQYVYLDMAQYSTFCKLNFIKQDETSTKVRCYYRKHDSNMYDVISNPTPVLIGYNIINQSIKRKEPELEDFINEIKYMCENNTVVTKWNTMDSVNEIYPNQSLKGSGQ